MATAIRKRDQIVELGLRETDGILRQLERAITQATVVTCCEGEPMIPFQLLRLCHFPSN
jgi:hypothetical protein